jgi:PKD repeat protein
VSAAAVAESVAYDTVSMWHVGIPLVYAENHTFYAPGNYTVVLPGEASNGCDSTIYVTVILANGIQNNSDMDDIILYPNPVSDILYLQFSDRQIESWTVFDINGKARH